MTLNEILIDALAQLDKSGDPKMLARYSPAFTSYANDAAMEIADDFRLSKEETVELVNGKFDINSLSCICTKINRIDAPWKVVGETVYVDTKDPTVTVYYRYLPKTMTNDTDKPGIPEQFHRLIVMYVVARHKSGGDADTQGTASVYYQLYNNMKSKLMRQYGQITDYRLVNIF